MGFNSAFKGLNVTQKIRKRDMKYNTAMKRDWMLEEITQNVCIGFAKGSRVRFQVVSLVYVIEIIFPTALWPWGRHSLFQK
jgi:hypothetical protein